jgi:chemotaxis protein CheD
LDQIKKIYVQGGEVIVAESPAELITILGSCVSVCLWDRKLKIGGMNHYLLPAITNQKNHLHGGISATKMLIDSMLKGMATIKNLEARILGGGNRFFSETFLVVGSQNVEVAEKVLGEAKIPIVLKDTGGEAGRKVFFNTETGEVKVSLVH